MASRVGERVLAHSATAQRSLWESCATMSASACLRQDTGPCDSRESGPYPYFTFTVTFGSDSVTAVKFAVTYSNLFRVCVRGGMPSTVLGVIYLVTTSYRRKPISFQGFSTIGMGVGARSAICRRKFSGIEQLHGGHPGRSYPAICVPRMPCLMTRVRSSSIGK